MTEVEKTEVVRQGSATPELLTAGLLDGPSDLRDASGNLLVHTGTAFEELALSTPPTYPHISRHSSPRKRTKKKRVKTTKRHPAAKTPAQRFGLPENFVPRMQRSGRSVLIEDNIYRLPNGQEYIPCHPTGTLGKSHHLYSLLTASQHKDRRRGSVYIRMDGRIFDYSFDRADPDRDFFDTGYTIYDLERTGQYAQVSSQGDRSQTGQTAKRKTTSVTAGGIKA
jgi:hypothetical protein